MKNINYCQCGCGTVVKRTFANGHNRRIPSDIASHFWKKVNIKSENECWEWQGGFYSNGYPVFWNGKKNTTASRYAYILTNGPLSQNIFVCHHCDNPKCCNPNHLFAGTHSDNMQDMLSKYRARKQLTKEVVEQVIVLLQQGLSQTEIAKQIGIGQTSVSRINVRYVNR